MLAGVIRPHFHSKTNVQMVRNGGIAHAVTRRARIVRGASLGSTDQ
jgi:hypothetical protein